MQRLRQWLANQKPFDSAQGTRQTASGFTLIELLVVISIIAILSLVVVTNLTSARTKARDAQRTSAILQVDKAIQLYMVNSNTAPAMPAPASNVGPASFITLVANAGPLVGAPNNYIPAGTTIKDPLNTNNQKYQFKNLTPAGQAFSAYALCVQLENANSEGANWYVSNSGSTSLQAADPCN